MNFLSKTFSLLLLPGILHGMERESDFFKQLQPKITLSSHNFMLMIMEEMQIITPCLDGSSNGYVELLKKVNDQLCKQGSIIDVSNNEFLKGKWDDTEIKKSFDDGVQEPQKMEIFRHKWRRKIREQLSRETPIQYIKRQNDDEAAESVIKARLYANKNIDPDNQNNQEKLRKVKEAIYYGLEIEDKVQGYGSN